MHDDVRLAALRAAAKLALGLSFVGCSGAESITAESAEDDAASGASEDLKKKRAKDAGPAACKDAGADAAAPSCKELLAATFADAAWEPFRTYRTEKAPLPPSPARAASCCRDGADGWGQPEAVGEHRWACCNLLGDGESQGDGVPAYCTPWGPPVPPAMRARGVA